MNKIIKTGILVLLLVIPVFLFQYFKFFGKNHYKLPVFFATDSVLNDKGQYTITEAHEIPDFSFKNQDGIETKGKEAKGKILVVDFFFSRCPGICPQMTNQLIRVQEKFKEDPQFQILSFTVDPEYDTVAVLKSYAQRYGAIPEKWNFLTGTKDSIYTLAQKGFFITAMEDRERPLDFIHSEKLVLIDKEGRIRGYYNGTDSEEVDRLITEIQVLQYEYAN